MLKSSFFSSVGFWKKILSIVFPITLSKRKNLIFSHCGSKAGFRPCQLLCVLKNPLKVKLQKGPFLPEVYYLLLFHFKIRTPSYTSTYTHSYLEMHISRFFNFPSGNGKFDQFPGREKPGNREKLDYQNL